MQDEITEERKSVTRGSTQITSTRIASTRITSIPRTVHRTSRITQPPPTESSRNLHRSTQLMPRTRRPTHHTDTPTTHEMKVYRKTDDEEQTSKMTLPPTTTALAIRKPVR